MKQPFLGVPGGEVKVLNPDGTYRGSYENHSLYDTKPPLAQPIVPGDYTVDRPANNLRAPK